MTCRKGGFRTASAAKARYYGLYVNGDLWRKVIPILHTHYRCIAVDGPLGHTPTRWQQPQPPIADLIVDAIALGLSDLTVVANNTGIAYTQVFVAIHPDKLAGLVLTPGDVVWNFLPLPTKWMRPLSSQLPGGITAIASF